MSDTPPSPPSAPASTRKPSSGAVKNFLWALVALAAAAALYEGSERAKRSRLLPDGAPAPGFALDRYQGGQVKIADLKGRVVMLDFWATWCEPCVAEMPALHRIAKEYEAKGLTFVAGNIEASQEGPEQARRNVQAFVTRVEPGLDPYVAFADEATQAQYRVHAYPTLYLIDRNGNVVDAMEGASPEFILRHHIERALR